MSLLLFLTTLALAQDAPLTEAEEPSSRLTTESASDAALGGGPTIEVNAIDPVQTGLGLLWVTCDSEPDPFLREACLGDLEQLALLLEDASDPDVVPLSQAGGIKRRTKGGFVVDISGIECASQAPSTGAGSELPWYLQVR